MTESPRPFELHPKPGRRLPPELRPLAVHGTAVQLTGGVRDPGFAPLLARIDDSFFHRGNEVDLFFDGGLAFEAVRGAIAGASEEILAESYLIRDDATGVQFQRLLCEAAARSVRVRVLADAFGSLGTKADYWNEMRRAGIDVQLFHRSVMNPWRYFRRDHRKILIVDGQTAFTGGMNVGDEYGSSLRAHAGGAWRDTEVRIRGPAAAELAAVFYENWASSGGPPQMVEVTPPGNGPGAEVLVLDARHGRGHRESAAVLAAIAGAARRRLWITNAYFAPARRGIELLRETVGRGVDVRLLLPGKSDVPILLHAAHGHYSRLLRSGVRIFQYESAVLHAKTAVVDDYVSVVGSSNLDFRSFRFNAECNVVVLDETTGTALAAAFEDDLLQSTEITPATWKERGWIHRSLDAAARRLSPLL